LIHIYFFFQIFFFLCFLFFYMGIKKWIITVLVSVFFLPLVVSLFVFPLFFFFSAFVSFLFPLPLCFIFFFVLLSSLLSSSPPPPHCLVMEYLKGGKRERAALPLSKRAEWIWRLDGHWVAFLGPSTGLSPLFFHLNGRS
jgi:hypothetical protein